MYKVIRRVFDILAAGGALLILLPCALPLFLALRLTSEGEIFYRQERLGYRNRPFQILKLATMLKDSANMPGGRITLRNDPRLTPLGGFLRRSKLNELPQLWNILVGDMTIIGPRPLPRVSLDLYTPEVQAVIYESRPGLTGIASLVFRDEEAFVSGTERDPLEFYTNVIFPYKGQLELWYYRHKSLMTDFKILVLTAWSVVMPSSAPVFEWFDDLPARPDGLRVVPMPPDPSISNEGS